MDSRRLVIIDGYSLLFRAFYGTRFLSTADGQPTNALFGFINMLIQIMKDKTPDAIVVALDAPGKTFRHADYPEYKGTRRETPEELISQLKLSRSLIDALNIPVLELVGYEADDIVGTLSKKAEEKGYETTIVTGDHDSLQLVDHAISVMVPQNGAKPPKTYDPEAVQERYGFEPILLIDYKALAGDSSDNIPGVAGIGDKSAKILIDQFGTVEEMLEQIEEIPEKFRKKIEPKIQEMLLSKRLATIDCEVPIDYDFSPYRIDGEHLEQARQKMLSLEFKTQLRRIEELLRQYMDEDIEYTPTISAEALAPEVLAKISSLGMVRDWIAGRPFALLKHETEEQKSMFEDESSEWLAAVGDEVRPISDETAKQLFAADPSQVIGHDLKQLYKGTGAPLVPPKLDTLIAAYVLQSERSNYEPSSLITAFLDVPPPETPEQTVLGLLRVCEPMREKIAKQEETRVLDEIELPLIPVLAEMEDLGIACSADMLREFSKQLEVTIDQIQTKVWELAGEEFKIGSPKQVGEILFDKMELPGGKKTKTGWATGAEILGDLAAEHEIAGEVLNWREVSKLKSTYADALPKMIEADGRIHTSFNQAVAATGRLSSNEPNLQNIPIRSELGRTIRQAFYAPEGTTLVSLDYSQIELRILAHMCKDEALVDAFKSHRDVHTSTAAQMFDIEQDQVTKEQRGQAKMLNYAVLYGVTGYGLANQLGTGFSPADANDLIETYNERFPRVKAFTEELIEEARQKSFTTTLAGRRRYFPEIHASNFSRRQAAERQAMNAPIQGTAADMIKIAMLNVHEYLKTSELKMLLQVHDELVFEAPLGSEAEAAPIKELMEQALPMDVPIEVDVKIGPNWNQMTPVD